MITSRRQVGFTLVETLVSLLLVAMIAAGLQQFYVAMIRGSAVIEASCEAEESAQMAIELIQRDLRDAGFSPDGRLRSGLVEAAEDHVRIARDLNGDGDTTDANERVGYAFDAENHRLMRRMGAAPPQPMLNNLAENGLRFAYYEQTRGRIRRLVGRLNQSERRRVRRVDVTVGVEIPNPYPGTSAPIRSVQTSAVCLRNVR